MPTIRTRLMTPALPHDRDRARLSHTGHPEVLQISIHGPRGGFKGFAYVKGTELATALTELGFGIEEESRGHKG